MTDREINRLYDTASRHLDGAKSALRLINEATPGALVVETNRLDELCEEIRQRAVAHRAK